MRCAIFGAAGFIGRHLVQHLAGEGHGCDGLDRVVPAGAAGDGVRWRACDVARDGIEIRAGTDAVFYLAQSPRYRDFPAGGDELFAVNAFGALRVAGAAIDAGASFLCFASSGSVYAPSFEARRETDPVRRDDAYALSKLVAEEMLALVGDRITVCCVRLFGVFGPGQATMLVPGIIGRLREGRAVDLQPHPLDPADHGGLRLSMTYVDDAVAVLARLAGRSLAGVDVGGPLNVAGPRAVSLRELATGLGAAMGCEPRFAVADRPRQSDFIADTTRLETLVDHHFIALDEACRRTVQRPAPVHGA